MRALLVVAFALSGLLTEVGAEVRAPSSARAPGAIERWILHFNGDMEDLSAATFTSLLQALPTDVRVTVAVPDERDETLFSAAVRVSPALTERIEYIRAGTSLSAWARDRYVIFHRERDACVLLPPQDVVYPGWRSDLVVGASIAMRTGSRMRRIVTPFHIEGGDLHLTETCAYIGLATVCDNASRLGIEEDDVVEQVADVLGRRVVVIGDGEQCLPHEHLDMYLHVLEDGRVLLGDPTLAAARLARMRRDENQRQRLEHYGVDSVAEHQLAAASYEAVARQLRRRGQTFRRVPALHARLGEVLLSWTNVITETRDGVALAYVPRYGLPTLDELAFRSWRRMGFVVRPIDASAPITEGGAIRCLANVVRRTPASTESEADEARKPAPSAAEDVLRRLPTTGAVGRRSGAGKSGRGSSPRVEPVLPAGAAP